MDYAEDGQFLGAEHVEDTETNAQHVAWKRAALAAAVTLSDYLTAGPPALRRVS